MNINNEFGLIITKNGAMNDASRTYINVFNSFNNKKNIIEINGKKDDLTLKKFQDLKKLVEKHLTDLIKISIEQTPTYFNENGLDGYGKNITVFLGGMQIYVDFAVTNRKVKEFGNLLLEKIEKIIEG